MGVQLTLVRMEYNINVPMPKIVLKAWKRLHNTNEKHYGVINYVLSDFNYATMLKLRKL